MSPNADKDMESQELSLLLMVFWGSCFRSQKGIRVFFHNKVNFRDCRVVRIVRNFLCKHDDLSSMLEPKWKSQAW